MLGLQRVQEKPDTAKNPLSYRNDTCTMNSNGGSSVVSPTRGIENYGIAEKDDISQEAVEMLKKKGFACHLGFY